jgi:hypothetical protein
VTFSVSDASDVRESGRYELVTIIEALHDMSRPVDALRSVRGLLSAGGSVLVVDELVEDEVTAPSETDRYHYGWSVVSCLPSAMGDPQTAATGAAMRASTVRRYATEAGFREVDVIPMETSDFRFYRLVP